MIYQGDTVRLKINFRNFSGVNVDPTEIKLTIYDMYKNQMEQFILDDANKENVGVYFYDYTPATELSEFIFEFSGLYNGNPTVVRDSLQIKFN